MNINPQFIQKLASEAFWSFVFKNNLQETGFPTEIDDAPEDLWSQKILLQMLMDMNDAPQEQPSDKLINELYHLVAETIIDHNKREKNITGILYQEDFKSCKDPNFGFKNFIDKQIADSDEESHYDLQLKGKYLNEGDLFLRTPLPSGILLKSSPIHNSLYIPNTQKALGFQKSLILPISDLYPLPVNEYGYNYFATGVFHIPTTQLHDQIWLKLIPNAMANLKGFNICTKDGEFHEGHIVPKSSIKKKNFTVSCSKLLHKFSICLFQRFGL